MVAHQVMEKKNHLEIVSQWNLISTPTKYNFIIFLIDNYTLQWQAIIRQVINSTNVDTEVIT